MSPREMRTMRIRWHKQVKALCMRAVTYCNACALWGFKRQMAVMTQVTIKYSIRVVALQDELDRVAITTTFADKPMALTARKASILVRMPTLSL